MAGYPVATSFVGRGPERSLLQRALEGAREGRGGLLFVGGATGMGVSRLLEHACDGGAAAGFRVIRVEAVEGDQEPYGPFRRALETSSTRAKRGRAAATAADERKEALPLALVPADLPVPARDRGRSVASRVGLSQEWGGLPLGELLAEPPTQEARLQELPLLGASMRVVDRLDEMVGTGPLLLCLDDFQWADPGSLGVVRSLAREARKRPWLVLVGFEEEGPAGEERPEGHGVLPLARSVQRESGALRVTLKGLPDAEVRTLAEQLLGGPLEREKGGELPAMLRRAGGNPFFVQEVVRSGLREGWVQRRPEGFRFKDQPADERVPTFLRGWVHRRLSALSEEDRVLLEAISVLGSEFDPRALAAILPEDPVKQRKGLERLERKHGLVHPVRPGHWKVDPPFLSAGVRAEMSGEVLRRYHRRAGEWHAAHDPGAVERIAQHYVEAVEPTLAHLWLERAWQAAVDRGDNESVVRLSRQGRALARATSNPESELSWCRREVQGLFQLGEVRPAKRVADEALAGALPGMARVELLTELALIESHLGDLPRSAALVERAAAEPVPPEQQEAAEVRVGSIRVRLALRGQRWEEAAREAQALLAREHGLDERARVREMNNYGSALASLGDYVQARSVLGEAMTLARKGGFAGLETNSRTALAMLANYLGDLAVARAMFEQQVEVCRKRGAVTNLVINTGNTAEMLLDMGELEESERALEAMFELASTTGLSQIEAIFTPLRARGQLLRGHPGQAEETLRPFLHSPRLLGQEESAREAHATMAMILLALDRAPEALKEAQTAGPELVGAVGPLAARVNALALAATGQSTKGELLLDQVIRFTQHAGRKLEHALALWDLGELLAREHRASEARARWDEALGLLRACGAVARAARLEARRKELAYGR